MSEAIKYPWENGICENCKWLAERRCKAYEFMYRLAEGEFASCEYFKDNEQ